VRRELIPWGTLRRSFVLPDWKIVYVPTPKAGATSLKWMLAEVQGEDLAAFVHADGPQVTRALNIHDRTYWKKTPRLSDLSDAALEEISTDNGWFLFSMVRHPATRVWSAWQSKLLLREAHFVQAFSDRPWFPRVPRALEEVAEDFESFVTALADEPGLIDADPHWRLQHVQVDVDAVPYTHVGRLESFSETRELLEAHLAQMGWTGTLQPRAENDTPLPLTRQFLTDPADKAIGAVYRADFDTFGYGDVAPVLAGSLPPIELALIGEVGRLVGRAERVGDLSARLRQFEAPLVAVRQVRSRAAKMVATVRQRAAGRRHPGGPGTRSTR